MLGLSPADKDLLYRTVAAEAGGESALGQQGVVHTILNRARSGQYPGSVGDVIRQPGQFSALNHLTGYAKGQGALPKFFDAGYKVNPNVIQNVNAVLAGDIPDPTGGALNYYNPASASPKWGPGMANPVTIGAHRFGTAGGKMDPIKARINQGFSAFGEEEPNAPPLAPVTAASNAQQGGLGGIFNENRQALMGLGMDLIRRGLDTRRGFSGRGMLRGSIADQRRREQTAQKQQANEQRNMTAEYIARTRPDLAQAVQAGVLSPSDAYRISMQPGAKPEYREVGGKLYQMQDGQASLVPGIDYQSGGGFAGTGANVQAVNDMIARGEITREQGAQWLSGKVVTGPEGQLIHITPEQVFGGQPQTRSAGGSTGTQITPPKETPQMRQAKGFYDRMLSSQDILAKSGLEEALTEAWSAGAEGIIGGRYVQSDAYKSARQAAENWIRANLRKESGAAIGEKEMEDEYAVYFPMPGEGPEIIAQKRQAREIATQNMLREAEGSAAVEQMDTVGEKADIIRQAEEAIAQGADPNAVWQRTIEKFKGM